MQMNRRHFLALSGAAAVTILPASAWGANERIRVGVAGLQNRGRNHISGILAAEHADLVAVCDVDQSVLDREAKAAEEKLGRPVKQYRDYRDMLADPEIDAVTIAMPNHWHVLAAIWGLDAGKHVYVEKPLCHTYWEGLQLIAAEQRAGKILMHGTQRRSEPLWQRMVERARAGVIGDIYLARCVCFNRRDAIPAQPDSEPPAGLDWSLWQGPAPEQAFNPAYVHYNWHWFWRYGNGEVGNNLVHFTDIANWALDRGLPVKIHTQGGRYGYEDAAETPNTQVSTATFADGTMLVNEVRGRFSPKEHNTQVGLFLYGSEGWMAEGKFFDTAGQEIPDETPLERVNATDAHLNNFVEAIRDNDPRRITSTARQGLEAAAICHLGDISYRVGRTVHFDADRHQILSDAEANALLTRDYRKGFEVPALA
jgi:predicted dehydrogenase